MDNSDRILLPQYGRVAQPHRYKMAEQDTCGSVGTLSPYIQALYIYAATTTRLTLSHIKLKIVHFNCIVQLWRDDNGTATGRFYKT